MAENIVLNMIGLPQFGGMLGASADRGNIAKLQELLRDKP